MLLIGKGIDQTLATNGLDVLYINPIYQAI